MQTATSRTSSRFRGMKWISVLAFLFLAPAAWGSKPVILPGSAYDRVVADGAGNVAYEVSWGHIRVLNARLTRVADLSATQNCRWRDFHRGELLFNCASGASLYGRGRVYNVRTKRWSRLPPFPRPADGSADNITWVGIGRHWAVARDVSSASRDYYISRTTGQLASDARLADMTSIADPDRRGLWRRLCTPLSVDDPGGPGLGRAYFRASHSVAAGPQRTTGEVFRRIRYGRCGDDAMRTAKADVFDARGTWVAWGDGGRSGDRGSVREGLIVWDARTDRRRRLDLAGGLMGLAVSRDQLFYVSANRLHVLALQRPKSRLRHQASPGLPPNPTSPRCRSLSDA